MFFAVAFGLLLLSCDLGTVECSRVKIKKHALLKESLPQHASAPVESKVSEQLPAAGAARISASVAGADAAVDSVELSMQRSHAAGADATASRAPLAAAQPHASTTSAMITLSSVIASVRAHVPAPSIQAGYISLLLGTGLFIIIFFSGGLRFRKRRDFPNHRASRRLSHDPGVASDEDKVVRCKSYEYKMRPEEEEESDDESGSPSLSPSLKFADEGDASEPFPMQLQHQYSLRSEVDGEGEDVDRQSPTTVDGQSSEGKTAPGVFSRGISLKSVKEEKEEEEEVSDANDAKPTGAADDSEDGLIEF